MKPPRKAFFYGMRAVPHYGRLGTWLEPEEHCYPNGGMKRRCHAINVETGRLMTVRCGIPDTYFSIPAKGGWIDSHEGIYRFHPNREVGHTVTD